MRRAAFLMLALTLPALAGDVEELAARIEFLAAKEPAVPRLDTLRRAATLLKPVNPCLAAHFQALAAEVEPALTPRRLKLPAVVSSNSAINALVQRIEHEGDDPAAYEALAEIIRARQLSAGLDNPSIRARIALLDLADLLDPPLTALDGAQLRLSFYREKTVVIAFWATWCVPCRAELARLESQVTDEMTVLAVSRESSQTVRAFLREHPYKLIFLADPRHKLADRFHIDALPATVTLEPLDQSCQ